MKRFIMAGAVLVCLGACGGPLSGDVTADYIESAVSDAQREALRRGKRNALDTLSVRVETTDAYGNEGTAPALTFIWKKSDLERANWKTIKDYQVLDLASVRIDHRNGVIALHHWCERYSEVLTPRLCGQEKLRAENEWVTREERMKPQG